MKQVIKQATQRFLRQQSLLTQGPTPCWLAIDNSLIALLDAIISLSSNAWKVILSLQWTLVMLILAEPASALPREHVSAL